MLHHYSSIQKKTCLQDNQNPVICWDCPKTVPLSLFQAQGERLLHRIYYIQKEYSKRLSFLFKIMENSQNSPRFQICRIIPDLTGKFVYFLNISSCQNLQPDRACRVVINSLPILHLSVVIFFWFL